MCTRSISHWSRSSVSNQVAAPAMKADLSNPQTQGRSKQAFLWVPGADCPGFSGQSWRHGPMIDSAAAQPSAQATLHVCRSYLEPSDAMKKLFSRCHNRMNAL